MGAVERLNVLAKSSTVCAMAVFPSLLLALGPL